ncbi:hypothetical protein JOB18_027492 [Solea senegalensis]|uniref:Uncharacterized protein n=1 Tax=Solea senegalensis TaxID=28829 RepID=A0AAV6SBB5_SOLSE|nr:hypothetical protein JOB18_027492 [Solea senegalensis]
MSLVNMSSVVSSHSLKCDSSFTSHDYDCDCGRHCRHQDGPVPMRLMQPAARAAAPVSIHGLTAKVMEGGH